MPLRSLRIFFITVIVVSVSVLSNALPTFAVASLTLQKHQTLQVLGSTSSASTINTSDTIILIHGVSGNSKTDCNSYWNNTQQYLQGTHTVNGQNIHWTGLILKIGYYTNDYNCDINFAGLGFSHCKGYEDTNLGTNNESIKHLACELAWYIYTSYTQHNRNVEVVDHSMGGLITRWAITCSTASTSKVAACTSPSNKNPFPDVQLLVRDIVDFDTPNGAIDPKLLNVGGTSYQLGNFLGCTKKNGTWICPTEVQQMETGSSFMKNLDNYAQNPQGAQGTLWTLMGVTKGIKCLSLPPTITTYMDGGNKIEYTFPCYSHVTIPFLKDYAMMDDPPPTDTLNGKVQYCDHCSKSPTTWQNSSVYPHALLRTLYALTEQPIFHNGELFVTTTADLAPPCTQAAYSLRCAITQANNDGTGDTIKFGIPSSDSGCKLTTIQGQSVYVCTITPASSIPQLFASNTIIDGYTQLGAQKNTLTLGNGDNAILTIRINASTGMDGVVLAGNASNDTIRGLEITNFYVGIVLTSNTVSSNTIEGNFLGTNGTSSLGNIGGISLVAGTTNNTIGGTTPDTVNLISGNRGDGIGLGSANGNIIEGNLIGTDTSGKKALGNGGDGIQLGPYAYGDPTSNNNTIGGTVSGAANVIVSSTFYGVEFDGGSGNTVEGNFIGTDASGMVHLGNGSGVSLQDSGNHDHSTNNTVGGILPASANIIAFNSQYGIFTSGGSNENIIGNTINANYIGIQASNQEAGDSISQNVIENSTDAGILIGNSSSDITAITISQNSIFSNGGLGIDYYPADIVNCSGNNYISCPIITSATTTQVSGTACSSCVVEIYIATNEQDDQGHGEGKTFIGSATADGNGNWSVNVSLSTGDIVTGTTTVVPLDAPSATSEFGANVTVQ